MAISLMLGINYLVKMNPTPNRVESHQPPLKTKEIFTGLNFMQAVIDRLFH
jgi:hypothetical protein